MLEKKKKSKSVKRKQKLLKKMVKAKVEKEYYIKNRCQAINKDGKRCKRISDFSLDLTNGYKIKSISIIPKMDCCFLCSQHFSLKFSDLSTRLLYETMLYILKKELSPEEKVMLNIDSFFKELENIERTGNKWGVK